MAKGVQRVIKHHKQLFRHELRKRLIFAWNEGAQENKIANSRYSKNKGMKESDQNENNLVNSNKKRDNQYYEKHKELQKNNEGKCRANNPINRNRRVVMLSVFYKNVE